MADKSPSLEQLRILSADELTSAGIKLDAQPSLAEQLAQNEYESQRNTSLDTAVGIYDTLQTISTAALSPLPGVGLSDIGRMSQELDQFRSPAYLAERERDAQRVADATQAEGEWAGFKEGVATTLEGGNLAPDALAQIPYLAIGPAARVMGSSAAMAVPGVLGRATAAIGGTSKVAVVNRIAALSGALEGAGGYSQTYERAIADGLSPEEADAQAQKAGVAAAVAGTVLGKLTPGFELDPLGIKRGGPAAKFLGDIIAPTLSNVAGEAVEEGGIALTNQVADNILAGKEPLEGVGGQIGQAVTISTVFSGGMQSPGLVRDTSRAIGRGVRDGLAALSSGIMARATTPQSAAADAAAEVVNETAPTQKEVIQSTAAEAAATPSTTDNIEVTSDNIASDVVREQPEFELDGNAPPILRRGRPKSNSPAVENVLLNAQYELAIDQTDDEQKQAELIASQEEFAADVEQATATIEKLTPEAVAERVEKNDEQSQLLVEAVRLTDVTKLPESELSEDEQAIAQTIRDLSDTNVDRTAQQIFEEGFAGKIGSRGIRGFLQSILNYGRLIGDKPNEGSQNLVRFVGVLQDRANLFRQALAKMNDGTELAKDLRGFPYIDVIGSKTLDKDGNLTDKPFRIWTNLPNSVATAERVIQDADRASGALENARNRFPGMFPVAKAPVVTPAAATAPAAPTPTPAPAVVTPPADEGGLSLADEAPVNRTAPDLEANARKEEGLYPDQPKNPNSTRFEDENGLIDIDMRGDTWIGTNSYNFEGNAERPAAPKGSGLERLKMALRMAKAAGKKYNSDQSLSGSALAMYLKAIDAGIITATLKVDRKTLDEAREQRNGYRTTNSETISAENSVFQDVQLVEEVAPTAVVEPTVEEIPAPKAAKPKKAKKLKPHKNAMLLKRLTKEAMENITEMVRYARWDQRGGGIVRESEDYKSAVIGRLPWLPSVLWWNEIARKDNGDPFVPLDDSKEVVAKAVRIAEAVRTTGKSSEWLGSNQEGFVNALLDLIEAEQASRQQELDLTEAAPAPTVVEPVETAAPTPTVAEQVEAREEGPPSLSDEEMDSLMESGEQVNDDSWFEAEQASATEGETETEQATNPLTLAPLEEGQSWVNPDLLKAFKLDPLKSVIAMLTKLQRAVPRDAAYLNTFAAQLRATLDQTFADGIAKKKLDEVDPKTGVLRLTTFLERPYGVFVQALIRTKDGKLEMHPAFREALTYAALLQLHRAPEQYDADGLIDEKTGLPIRSAQAHAWARNIARDTALLLGMKPEREESEAITQGVLLSLGLTAVQALINNNDVILTKENIMGKDYNLLTLAPGAKQNTDNHPALLDSVTKIIGAPKVYTATTTPSTNIPERVNNRSTEVSEAQGTSITNLNSVGHYMNPLMMRMLEAIGQGGFNRLATGTILRDDMPKAVRDWIRAKVTGIRSEIRAANHYQKMLGEAVNDPLFWEYGIDSNGRMSSYMGPQGYTLLRDLFSSAKATITLSNSIHVQKTELAIAQALGIKLDGTPQEIETAYRKKVEEVGDKAKKLVNAINQGQESDILATLERGTPLKPRELAGMLTLGELLLAKEAGAKQLTTFLPIEVDGKTNGAVNAELLYGLGGTQSEANLEQGGVFLDTGETSWGERISYIIDKFKEKDLYLRVAATAVPIFQKIRSDELFDAGVADIADVKAKQSLINTLLIATDMLNSEGTAFLREAAKRASNPTVYGAGKKGVASQLISDMRSNLVGKWINLDYQKSKANPKEAAKLQLEMDRLEGLLALDESTWEDAAFAAGEALLESYKIQKPNVTRVTELMVKLTTFGFAVKMAEWAGMHDRALKDVPRNAAIPDKNSKGQTTQKWPLSRKQYQDILRSLFSMRFGTSANPEAVNLDDGENDESAFRVEGLGTTLNAQLDLPQPANPRVSVLALTTIGAGDASMGTLFLQTFRQITNVWDGIEMIPTEVDDLSVELNKAAWEAVNFDALADFEKTATVLRQHLLDMSPDMQPRVLDAYNSLVPEKQQLVSFYGDPLITIGGEQAPSLFNEVADLERKLINEHKDQQEGLAKLKARQIYFVQMANGKGYSPPVETRDAAASPENKAGWNDTIDSTFQMLGDKTDRKTLISMLDGVKWNRVQAYVWNRLKPLIPAGLSVTFARNAEQWEQATGKNDYGRTNGRTFIDGERIVLATAAPSVILHEVMHATLTKLISNYTLNPATVPVGVRTAVNNLVQLLPTFRAMTDPRLSAVQGQIWKLQDVWQDTAAAVDEMMTYVLTDPVVMKAVSPSFVRKLYNRIREVFWSFLGKEVPTSFLDEVVNSFTALTNDITTEDMGSFVAGTTRDAVNPLDALSLRAFNKLAQIVARRPDMRTRVGNILKDSLIDTIKGQYTLSTDQQNLYNRVFTLLRLNARKGELEQFVSIALPKHHQANLFNGATDLTASVMALAAVEPTFAAQLEQLYRINKGETNRVDALIDKLLDDNQHLRVEEMLSETMSAIIADSEFELSKLGLATSRLDRLGSKGLQMIGEKAEEWAEDAPRGVSDFLKGISALTTENGAEAFGRGLMAYMNTATNSQALQSLMGALVGSQNDTNAVYRQVKRFKSVVARTRSEFTIVLPKVLKNLFPEEFDGWNDLYENFARLGVEVLGTDAALMFTNDEARRRMITALESKVPNKWDAQNLAHYMVHGELPANTPHALLRNARAIADNLNGTPVTASDELVADVDQLVTLYAIEALSEVKRNKVKRMFLAHPSQMENLIGMLQKVRAEESKQLKDQYRYTYWKGELPLTTDPRHSIVIAGKVQGAKLEQLGYKRGDKYKQSAGDPQSDLYYYTRPYAPPPVFAQGILATVQQTAMGINYTTAATITPEVGTMITNRRLVEYIKKNQGKASKLIPIHNFQGQVVGYERMLDRQKVREYTGSNNTLLHISIGQKLGRILEERWANTFNQQAIQILVNQWEDGKRRGTEDQYESVNSTTNKQVARAWEVIPGHIKKQLEDAFGGPVMIRRDLIENTLGYHNAGVGDVFTGDASLSENTRKIMMGIAQTIFMGPRAAQILYASEAAIKEGVATARDWIIVRSMSVAYNNFMASINLVISNGVPIRDVVKYYRQGMQDVRVYSRLQNENIELMVKIAAAQGTEKIRLQTLQKGKLAAMKRLSIHPLIEAGELSDLPEGLIESPDNTYLGDISGWLNKKLSMISPKMPMVAANLLIAKDSQFHDTLSKAVQTGDFLARYAVFQHMVNTGQGIENARDTVRDEFIAYAINPGRTRGYAENMGLVHWTQFTIRAQKVLLHRIRRNPFSFFVGQMAGSVTGTDGPVEMAITERGFDNSVGLDNVFNASTAHIYSKLL